MSLRKLCLITIVTAIAALQRRERCTSGSRSMSYRLVADKEGNIWFTAISGGYVGKLDPKTGEIAEDRPPDVTKVDPHTPVF
jgi:streptogramin lyase